VYKSWDKKKGETRRSYEKFRVFLGIDPTQRTVRKRAELTKCSLTSIEELSKRHNWQKRASDYDRFHEQQALAPSFQDRLEQQKTFYQVSPAK
jgi:hypothetical protein